MSLITAILSELDRQQPGVYISERQMNMLIYAADYVVMACRRIVLSRRTIWNPYFSKIRMEIIYERKAWEQLRILDYGRNKRCAVRIPRWGNKGCCYAITGAYTYSDSWNGVTVKT